MSWPRLLGPMRKRQRKKAWLNTGLCPEWAFMCLGDRLLKAYLSEMKRKEALDAKLRKAFVGFQASPDWDREDSPDEQGL